MMKSNHLSDEKIQAYILNEVQDEILKSHIDDCPACQLKLDEFRFLIESVKKLEPEVFSFDVSALVMENVELYEKKKSVQRDLFFWGILGFLLLFFSFLSIPFLPMIAGIFYLKSAATSLLLVGTGVGVFIFLTLDIIRQNKKINDKYLRVS